MIRTFFLLLMNILFLSGNATKGYLPIDEGHWPFRSPGFSFTPNEKSGWVFSTHEDQEHYKIYFYYTGKGNHAGTIEAGGIQVIGNEKRFGVIEQFMDHLNSLEDLHNDPTAELLKNTMYPDSRYSPMCVRYSRKFKRKAPQNPDGMEESIADEGYYFIHPKNPNLLFKVHLFKKGVAADQDTSFGFFMQDFYKFLVINEDFAPKWSVGASIDFGAGFSDGLFFGYYDANTNEPITIDPVSGQGMIISVTRKIQNCWIAGAGVGFSGTTLALSGTYSNIFGKASKGLIGELHGGMLLFSKFRNRCSITAGPIFYSSPSLKISVTDSAGPGDIAFEYKPVLGISISANYIFVMKKNRGQFFWGLKFHGISNYELKKFKTGGQVYEPDMLNPILNDFKRANANGVSVILIGYQYNFG